MPKINVKKACSLKPEELFAKVSDVLNNDSELKKLDPTYACTFEPSSLSGVAKGKLFSANMKIQPLPTGSEVEIQVELPFALALAKGLVQKTLEKKLDKVVS